MRRDQPVQHLSGEVVAAHHRERAVLAADRRAHGVDDVGVHGLSVLGRPRALVVREVDEPRTQLVDAPDRIGRAVDQLAHRIRDVAAEHDDPVVRLDDDRLVTGGVARRRRARRRPGRARCRRRARRRSRRRNAPTPRRSPVATAASSSARCTYVGTPANRRLPPQWSKCRCVLITAHDVAELRPRPQHRPPLARRAPASSRSSPCRRGSCPSVTFDRPAEDRPLPHLRR